VSESRGFIAAIIADPANDLPRLIYADYLDEREEHDRAEFIRVQCELARMRRCGYITNHQHHNPLPPSCNELNFGPDRACKECRASAPVRARERELLKKHSGAWTDCLPESITTKQCPQCADQAADYDTNVVECRHCDCAGVVFDDDCAEFRRGFVEEITCSWDDWRLHADAIRAATPLRKVRLTTNVEVRTQVVPRFDSPNIHQVHHADFYIPSRERGGVAYSLTESDMAKSGLTTLNCPEIILEMLVFAWPGIEFELPMRAEEPADALARPVV
jgi:uncharacterized protein (TIGR02996 family)